MEHSAVRKLITATTFSVLALMTASGVAGWKVMAAGSAAPVLDSSGGSSAQETDPDWQDPPSTPTTSPVPPPPLPAPGLPG